MLFIVRGLETSEALLRLLNTVSVNRFEDSTKKTLNLVNLGSLFHRFRYHLGSLLVAFGALLGYWGGPGTLPRPNLDF